MWEPRRLTTLWAFTACYRDSFTLFIITIFSHLSGILGSYSGGYEEYCLLGYTAVYSAESQPTFRRNMSPTSSGSNKPSKKPARKQVANTALILFLLTAQISLSFINRQRLNSTRERHSRITVVYKKLNVTPTSLTHAVGCVPPTPENRK
jgi:hypothetical protein